MTAILDLELTLALKQLRERKWVLKKEFVLVGRAVPKARPRAAGRRVILPENYRLSQNELLCDFNTQKGHYWEIPVKCRLDFIFLGSFRGDADNLIGAYFDAMVKANVIGDDRLSILSEGQWAHYPGMVSTPTAVIKLLIPA